MALTKTPIELSSTPSIVDNSDGPAITIDINENVTVSQNFTVDGDTFLNGNLTLGDAFTDTINFSSVIGSNIVPETTNTHDLGTTLLQWRDLFIDGTANINIVAADSGSTVGNFQVGGDLTVIGSPNLPYDNVVSGLTANTVQSAITEIASLVGAGNVGSQASFDIFEFTATGGQTTFDLSGVHSQTYIVGYLQVFLNGLMLSETDYTANDGANVVLSVAAELGDILTIVKVDSFDTAQILRTISIDASATTNAISLDQNDNVTLLGELRGPASFVIDPAAIGDNTGVVVIKGDLQVDGSQTTINSTTLDTEMVKVTGTFPSETSVSTGYFDYAAGTARITSKGIDDTTLGAFSIVQQASDASPESTPFHINTSSDIGVGLTTQTEKFEVRDGNVFLSTNANTADTGSSIFWQSVDTGWDSANAHASIAGKRVDAANGYLQFNTRSGGTTSEVARFDASGNLLVGKTSTGAATAGIELNATNDLLRIARDGGVLQELNRITSDGDIIEFRKDNAPVGSIGAVSGYLYVGGTAGDDAFLSFGADGVRPATSAGAARDAAIDLGGSSNRFKDLHLSGGVYTNGDKFVYSYAGGVFGQVRSGIKFDGTNNQLEFYSSQNEAMRIDSTGNLLVGRTAATSAKLHLENATDVHMDMNSTGDNRGKLGSKVNDLYIGHSSSAANIIFKKNIVSDDHPADSGDETMRIDSSGNVGIGVVPPSTQVSYIRNVQIQGLQAYGHTGINDWGGFFINSYIDAAGVRKYISSSQYAYNLHFDNTGSFILYNAPNTNLAGDTVPFVERFRIDSSGYVGIGTNSPGVELDIKRTDNTYPLRIQSVGGEGRAIAFADVQTTPTKYNWIAGAQCNTDNAFEITPSTAVGGYTFSTPAITILETGDVGIGASSPATGIDVTTTNYTYSGTTYDIYGIIGLTSGGVRLGGDSSNSDSVIGTTGTGNMQFVTYDGSAWGSRMTLTNTGNVGIGTSSITSNTILHMKDTDTQIELESTNGSNSAFIDFDGTNLQLSTNRNMIDGAFSNTGKSSAGIFLVGQSGGSLIRFATASADNTTPTTSMTLDSFGSLNVSRSAYTSASTNGFHANVDGWTHTSVSGEPTAYFNRNTSDGEVVRILKDGATVGSIDTHSGVIQFGQGNVNLAFENATDTVYPVNDSGTNNNGDIDLGKTNARFKDLHLSGKVVTNSGTQYGTAEDIYNGGSGRTFQIPISTNGEGSWIKINAMNADGIIEQTIFLYNVAGQWNQRAATANTTGTPPTITVNLGTPSTTGSIVVLGQGPSAANYGGGFISYEMGPGLTFA